MAVAPFPARNGTAPESSGPMYMKKILTCFIAILLSLSLYSQQESVIWGDWQEWGEVENEKLKIKSEKLYKNPIVPDVDYCLTH